MTPDNLGFFLSGMAGGAMCVGDVATILFCRGRLLAMGRLRDLCGRLRFKSCWDRNDNAERRRCVLCRPARAKGQCLGWRDPAPDRRRHCMGVRTILEA